jgi:hypothetical protein
MRTTRGAMRLTLDARDATDARGAMRLALDARAATDRRRAECRSFVATHLFAEGRI